MHFTSNDNNNPIARTYLRESFGLAHFQGEYFGCSEHGEGRLLAECLSHAHRYGCLTCEQPPTCMHTHKRTREASLPTMLCYADHHGLPVLGWPASSTARPAIFPSCTIFTITPAALRAVHCPTMPATCHTHERGSETDRELGDIEWQIHEKQVTQKSMVGRPHLANECELKERHLAPNHGCGSVLRCARS